jgi:hypothetical protein
MASTGAKQHGAAPDASAYPAGPLGFDTTSYEEDRRQAAGFFLDYWQVEEARVSDYEIVRVGKRVGSGFGKHPVRESVAQCVYAAARACADFEDRNVVPSLCELVTGSKPG